MEEEDYYKIDKLLIGYSIRSPNHMRRALGERWFGEVRRYLIQIIIERILEEHSKGEEIPKRNNIGYPVVSRRILEVGSLVSYSRNRRLSDQTVNPLSIKQRDVRRMDSCGYSRTIR